VVVGLVRSTEYQLPLLAPSSVACWVSDLVALMRVLCCVFGVAGWMTRCSQAKQPCLRFRPSSGPVQAWRGGGRPAWGRRKEKAKGLAGGASGCKLLGCTPPGLPLLEPLQRTKGHLRWTTAPATDWLVLDWAASGPGKNSSCNTAAADLIITHHPHPSIVRPAIS